jgi:hypothetical protein
MHLSADKTSANFYYDNWKPKSDPKLYFVENPKNSRALDKKKIITGRLFG